MEISRFYFQVFVFRARFAFLESQGVVFLEISRFCFIFLFTWVDNEFTQLRRQLVAAFSIFRCATVLAMALAAIFDLDATEQCPTLDSNDIEWYRMNFTRNALL